MLERYREIGEAFIYNYVKPSKPHGYILIDYIWSHFQEQVVLFISAVPDGVPEVLTCILLRCIPYDRFSSSIGCSTYCLFLRLLANLDTVGSAQSFGANISHI